MYQKSKISAVECLLTLGELSAKPVPDEATRVLQRTPTRHPFENWNKKYASSAYLFHSAAASCTKAHCKAHCQLPGSIHLWTIKDILVYDWLAPPEYDDFKASDSNASSPCSEKC
jgi:hypothetical protein